MLNSRYSYRGFEWETHKELAIKLGMNRGYVSERIKKGKTCKEIIDSILDRQYKGIIWYSDSDLSRVLGKSEPYVKRHLAKGESYEEIIDIILNKQACISY